MRQFCFLLLCLVAFTFLALTPVEAKTHREEINRNLNLSSDSITFLALGDSYTVGRMVPQQATFPYQLAAKLSSKKLLTAASVLIAQNGWRTDELLKGIANSNITKKFDFVTLLIGVNNQFQSYSQAVYQTEFTQLLNAAIILAGGNASHVFVLSIPDWGVMPYANGRNLEKITADIDAYNTINKAASKKAGVNYIDVTTLSRYLGGDADYVAADRLHPSGKMYSLWVQKLAPAVINQFKK